MSINGTQIKAHDATPQTVGAINCEDEAAFNAILAKNGGLYWAQAWNMPGKIGTECKTVFNGYFVSWFMKA